MSEDSEARRSMSDDRESEPPPSADPPRSPAPLEEPRGGPSSTRDALAIPIAATIATFLVMSYAFAPAHAGSPGMLGAIFGLDLSMAIVAILRMRRRGEVSVRGRLARGDIWLGGMVAGLLYGGAMIGHLVLTPHHTPREGWIIRLYLQLGDPRGEGRELVSGLVFVVAALEEIAWRGLVQRVLEDKVGALRAVLVTSLLFAVAHVPTLWLLADPAAGPNPLIVVAAIGCSIVWGAIAIRTQRIIPSIIAHALFSWAIVEFPIWRL